MTEAEVAERLRILVGLEKRLPAWTFALMRRFQAVNKVLLPRVYEERRQEWEDGKNIQFIVAEHRRLIERNALLEAENAKLKAAQEILATQVVADDTLLVDAQTALRVLRTVLKAKGLKMGVDATDSLYHRISARWMRGAIIQFAKERLGQRAADLLKDYSPIQDLIRDEGKNRGTEV